MFRRAMCLLLVGCCLHSSVQAACGNIVALSGDGQYMVFEPDTLRMLEVGNLWWLGIYRNYGPEPGSSHSFAIIPTDGFVNLETGRHMMMGERERYSAAEPPFGLVALEEMGRNLRAWRDVPHVRFEQNEDATRYGPSNTVVSELFDPGVAIWEIVEDGRDILQLLDRGLRVIRTWEDPALGVGLRQGFCRDGNLLYLLGGERNPIRQMRIVLNGGEMSALPLRSWDEERYSVTRIDPHSCTAMATKRVEGNDRAMDDMLFDFRDERIISTGERYRYADIFFFNYGANILRRYLERTGNLQPRIQTDRFLVVDTESLSVVRDESLDARGWRLSDELICEPENPRAVLLGGREIALIDLRDLTIVARKTLPWGASIFE